MNILLLTSHSIAEHDDLRMFTDLGYPTYSIGGAYDEVPFEGKRPALPNVIRYPDLEEATNAQRVKVTEERGDPGRYIDWGKAWLAPDVIDWADVIIVHHFPERWIGDQWQRIKHKRVIWRTCGQSDPRLEMAMRPFHDDGLQVVRYSPKEQKGFEPNGWAGQDALIRFGKYPDDYGPYIGDIPAIGNVTQDMAKRGESCGYDRWLQVTDNIATMPAGPGSEVMRGGLGSMDYPAMLDYLRHIRGYLYTGTIPASYTLGLIEAMLSGVPVVPVGWDTEHQWLQDLWEANEIVPLVKHMPPDGARPFLQDLIRDHEWATFRGNECRERAIELFDVATAGAQWAEFLG